MFQKLVLMLMLMVGAYANDADMARLFEKAHMQGTMLIESLDGTTRYVYNEERAKTPLIPASTFKIPNTLIALQEGVVNADTIIKWDGTLYSMTSWNQDQTLRSAFKNSCLWCYQKFAKEIGVEKYRAYLQKLAYGNAHVGNDVARFWLDGSLRISVYEQIAFLKKLYANALPFDQANIDLLKSIMVDEQTSTYTVFAKTGWAVPKDAEHHGWYVGYVQSPKGVYFFATNLILPTEEGVPLRKTLTLEALKTKGILE